MAIYPMVRISPTASNRIARQRGPSPVRLPDSNAGIRTYYLNRSQPPLFSEMVRIVWEATGNRALLRFVLAAVGVPAIFSSQLTLHPASLCSSPVQRRDAGPTARACLLDIPPKAGQTLLPARLHHPALHPSFQPCNTALAASAGRGRGW